MDEECLKLDCQTVEQGRKTESEAYVEVSGAESSRDSTIKLRRSSRLLSKKRESSCTSETFGSEHNDLKCTVDSPKAGLVRNNFIFGSKVGVDNMDAHEAGTTKSSTSVPCFRYHVQSKEGIRLVVDLNSSQSERLKSMENAVCICQKHQNNQFQSFRQELEYLGDTNNLKRSLLAEKNSSDVHMVSYEHIFSSQNAMSKGNVGLELDEQHGGDELLHISTKKTLRGDSRLSSELNDHVYSSSKEIQFSDFANQPKDLSCSGAEVVCSHNSVDVINNNAEAEKNILTCTNEVYQETDVEHTCSTIEDWERENSAMGIGVSDTQKKRLRQLVSNDGQERKKHEWRFDLCVQNDRRILRSTKLLGGQIFQRGGLIFRRSSRLVSK